MPISIFPVLSHGKLLTLLDQSWNCDAESLPQHWRAKSLQDAAKCSIAESRVVLVTSAPQCLYRRVLRLPWYALTFRTALG
jgi:hypothetical protein